MSALQTQGKEGTKTTLSLQVSEALGSEMGLGGDLGDGEEGKITIGTFRSSLHNFMFWQFICEIISRLISQKLSWQIIL